MNIGKINQQFYVNDISKFDCFDQLPIVAIRLWFLTDKAEHILKS